MKSVKYKKLIDGKVYLAYRRNTLFMSSYKFISIFKYDPSHSRYKSEIYRCYVEYYNPKVRQLTGITFHKNNDIIVMSSHNRCSVLNGEDLYFELTDDEILENVVCEIL